MSDIQFNCPHCDQSLVVDSAGAGSTIDCPKCSAAIEIPTGRTTSVARSAPRTVQCPYCLEDVKEGSVRCKHCGADLRANAYESNPRPASFSTKQTFRTGEITERSHQTKAQGTSAGAVCSLIFGIIGFLTSLFFGWVLGLIAIICGHASRGAIRDSRGSLTGDGMAVAGLVLGYLSLIPALVILAGLLVIKAVESKPATTFDDVMRQMNTQSDR